VYKVHLNDSRNNLSVTCTMMWKKVCDLLDLTWMVRLQFYPEDTIFKRANTWWLYYALDSAKVFQLLF